MDECEWASASLRVLEDEGLWPSASGRVLEVGGLWAGVPAEECHAGSCERLAVGESWRMSGGVERVRGGLEGSMVQRLKAVRCPICIPPTYGRKEDAGGPRRTGGRPRLSGGFCLYGVGGWGGGVGTRPRWLALLACGGAYWPLTLEPSAMPSRHPHYCGHPHCRGHPSAWGGIQNATSAHGVLP